jgi:ribose-phosphate pyrophosphokinase
MAKNRLQVFSGSANPDLARRIAKHLDIPLGGAEISRFPDGEFDIKVVDDVRGCDIYIVQPTCPPVNENLMELLILIECIRRASAERITAVIPYFGYARQDRKAEGRVPITAKLVANLLTTAGASRVLTVDLHAAQIQGFFDIPVDHLYAAPVVMDHFQKMKLDNVVVVSPDVGGIKMARAYAKRLGAELAIVDKRRSGPSETEAVHVIGNVQGRNAILVDDMITTATSITEAAKALRAHGVKDVWLCATHAVLAGRSVEKIRKAEASGTVVTDSIPIGNKNEDNLFTVLSIAGLLGEAVRRIHRGESVSSLFV